MDWLKNQPWNTSPSYREVTGEVEWNLWQKRLPPFHTLETGNRVFLACGDGHGGSEITWEVRVTDVLRRDYASKDEAWKLLRIAFPSLTKVLRFTKASFMSQHYTRRAASHGWVLGWSYDP